MTIQSRSVFAVVALAATMLTSACNDPKPQPSPSASLSPSTTASPSPTATELTSAEQDQKSAGEAVTRYWKVIDELASDSTKSLNLVATAARDQAGLQARTMLGTDRAQGWTQRGQTSVTEQVATSENGTDFAVTACIDVSNVDVVDGTGRSVVRPERPDRQRYRYSVLKAPEGFFVTLDKLEVEAAC